MVPIMADDNNNVANYTRQASPFQNDKVYRGTTEYSKNAILRVFGDLALGESDYEARWAEFVKGVFSGGGKITPISDANYTILNSDYLILADASGNEIDALLPLAANFYDFDNDIGYSIQVKKIDISANTVDIIARDPELVDDMVKLVLTGFGDTYEVISDGATWWVK